MGNLTIGDKLERLVELSETFTVEQMFPRPMIKKFNGEYHVGEILIDSCNYYYYTLGKQVLFLCDDEENVFLPGDTWKCELDEFMFLNTNRHDELLSKIIFNKLVGNYHGKTLGEVFGSKPFVRNLKELKKRKVEDLILRSCSDSNIIIFSVGDSEDEDDENDVLALGAKGFRFINTNGYHEVPYNKIIEI